MNLLSMSENYNSYKIQIRASVRACERASERAGVRASERASERARVRSSERAIERASVRACERAGMWIWKSAMWIN